MPLSLKITLIFIVAVILQTGALLFIAYNELVEDEKEAIQHDMHIHISRMQQTLEFLSRKGEYEQLQNEISYLGSMSHVDHAVLFDETNTVIASTRLMDNQQQLESISAIQKTPVIDDFFHVRNSRQSVMRMTPSENRLLSMYPVNLGLSTGEGVINQRVGILYVDHDLSWINPHVRVVMQKKALPMLILLSMIGLLFLVIIHRYVVRRIEDVNAAASSLLDSGFKARARVSGNDEISELAASFNSMADTVEAKNIELIQKEEETSLLLDFMDNGVVSINEKGIVKSFNHAASKIFGYDESEIIGQNVNILMPEPFSSEHDTYIHNYVTSGVSKIIGYGREVIAMRKDGQEFFMNLHVSEMPSSEKGERLFIGTCLDVTEQKHQEMQLRHSQKMDALGKLTGGIAHDYNNMLGVILGYAELVKDEVEDNPRLLKYVNEIYHAGSRGAKLTKKLLSFSRKKTSEASVININEILNDNLHMLEKTLTVRVSIEYHLEQELWAVYVDENDLEDAILNLCINAMHAMEGTGNIHVYTRNLHLNDEEARKLELKAGAGDYVCLEICDTGMGIPEEIIGKIFDPFFSTKEEKGNGLGLSQVYGFMIRSHGNVVVESEPDHGACFSLYFPRYLQQAQTVKESGKLHKISRGTENILIVDDEESLGELLEAILSSQGYNVVKTLSGKQALQALAKDAFDLVISDVLMPEMDGYQLAQQIHQLYPGMKIQLVSGFSDDLHRRNKDEVLHANLLHKPFDRQQLLMRIRELLDS